MKSHSDEILQFLNPSLFWDVEFSSLDSEKSKRLIIERVFSLGTVEEMRKVITYYGEEEVIETLKDLAYLDPKTLNFVSKLFSIPKKDFKCFTPGPLTKKHWSY